MGATASIDSDIPFTSSYNLNKYCPNIKANIDSNYKTQVGVKRRPIYGIDDSCGYVKYTIQWADPTVKNDADNAENTDTDTKHSIYEEYMRAWDYLEWFCMLSKNDQEIIAENIREKKVVDFKIVGNKTSDYKLEIGTSKFCGTNIDLFKQTRKNYYIRRATLNQIKITSARNYIVDHSQPRNDRHVRHIFNQDYITHKNYVQSVI